MHHSGVGLEGDRTDRLLERSDALEKLSAELAALSPTAGGRVVVLAGEAGIGKTSLLRAFREVHQSRPRFLWGACDPLFTPQPLGPFSDVAEQVGGELQALVREGAKPFEIATALLRELAAKPTVLIIEDVHWADEASLDVLRVVSNRVGTVPALVIASYRDDELARDHPARLVLGELVRDRAVTRLRLDRLSPTAVAQLAEPHGIDAEELYRTTSGNPFFVTEALAAGGEAIPPTVRDAVLARVGRLPSTARALLEAVAISTQPTEFWLLEQLAAAQIDTLDACLAAGVVSSHDEGVAFRHELARLAFEDAIPARRRKKLHGAALAALAAHGDATGDLARLAHHADAAGDPSAVQQYAPPAGERASALGSHREAAAQYERALRYADDLSDEELAGLLASAAQEYDFVGRAREAVDLRRRSIAIYHAIGAHMREGDLLRALVWPLWLIGRHDDAESACTESVAVLEQCEPGEELAHAYAAMALLHSIASDGRTTEWAQRARALADDVGATRAAVAALIAAGTYDCQHDDLQGEAELERAVQLARGAGFWGEAATALSVLARLCTRRRAFEDAASYIDTGIDYCTRSDLDGWRPYFFALRAEFELKRGDWQRAADSAELVLRDQGIGPATVIALGVLGRLRARRGDPGEWALLDRARELAVGSGEFVRIAPVAIARAEAAWLEGRDDAARTEAEAAWDLALERGDEWLTGELAEWRHRGGAHDSSPSARVAEPYAAALAGDWRRAHDVWSELGCPYEAALAAADGDDMDALRGALDSLHHLGARATAARVTRGLRQRGIRGLPRGPRPRTSSTPGQLTPREVEVLQLVTEGLRNAEIAERLVVSVRTVDHHVSSILGKLDLSSRGQVAATAARLGLTRPS